MTNKAPNLNDQKGGRCAYDLCERTAVFGEAVIAFCKKVPVNPITYPLISQLVRSATSVGGNYCEADEAESRKEFRYRISVCKREAKETKHNIRMIVAAEPRMRDEAKSLWQEAKELALIFAAILRPK
ncbi:MAG TPA: four helix bundle protein [Tepidisphaeraceae bacterium]|jgi:four helix bundle protein|nr:four helix bundle protein [Tepidisphaeraceae bacterium]